MDLDGSFMIWFLTFIWSIFHLCSLLVYSLAFIPLCNFFRTKFDIGPYFMFLAGNLILDDMGAENTEKFPDIMMQTCLKRSKCKAVRIWKALCLSSKLALQPLGFSTAPMHLFCSSSVTPDQLPLPLFMLVGRK